MLAVKQYFPSENKITERFQQSGADEDQRPKKCNLREAHRKYLFGSCKCC